SLSGNDVGNAKYRCRRRQDNRDSGSDSVSGLTDGPARRGRICGSGGLDRPYLRNELIAAAWDRPNIISFFSKRLTQEINVLRKIALFDKRIGPNTLKDLVF